MLPKLQVEHLRELCPSIGMRLKLTEKILQITKTNSQDMVENINFASPASSTAYGDIENVNVVCQVLSEKTISILLIISICFSCFILGC